MTSTSTEQEYKLTLPRRVVATAWSRDLHIDHQPIEDVRLIDVLSRKQENWTLRLVANGRLVQYEGFRNRHEAYLWSSLSRKIFKSSDVDIARIIGHLHPSSLKDDWDEKRKGLDRLAERVFDYLRDQMPKNTTEALQDQVEQLMKENEKLKAATGRPSSPALSHSEPETPAERERLRAEKSKPLVTPPAPPRSGRTLDSHFKPATPEPEKTPPAVPSDPLHAYIVGTNRPVLEDNAPTKATKGEIDKWIKANIKDKARLTKLEDTASSSPSRPTSWTFPISAVLPSLGAGNLSWLRALRRMPSSARWPRPTPSSTDGFYNNTRRPLLTTTFSQGCSQLVLLWFLFVFFNFSYSSSFWLMRIVNLLTWSFALWSF